MKLSELFAIDSDVEITEIVTDSRKVLPGCLFLCLAGEHTDGHYFAQTALDRGAAAVVTERRLGVKNEILVPDTHRAASALYATRYGYPQNRMKIIGVTGTNGKTSTVSLLNAIYTAAGHKTAVFGTLGMTVDGMFEEGENTTPLPEILYRKLKEAADVGVDTVLMEVSSHALATHRVADIVFDTAIYTNLTQDHLDYHKSMAEYAKTKGQLFRQCRKGLFNFDDPYSYYASQVSPCRVYGYGYRSNSDFRLLKDFESTLSGIRYRFSHEGRESLIISPLIGDFQIFNTVAAAASALLDGIPAKTVTEALAAFGGIKGRCEILYQKAFTVLVDYAHTPDALLSVLTALKTQLQRETDRQSKNGRLVVLFGCGGDRDKSKRPQMGRIACLLADSVIVTSDNARSEDKAAIIGDILAGMDGIDTATTFKVIEDRRQALRYAVSTLGTGDILLVAGKGHEEYEIDCYGKHDFSERQILIDELTARGLLP